MSLNKNGKLQVKDHSVSGECFDIAYDEELGVFKTIPQPDPIDLPKYYESENYISHTDSKRSLMDKLYQFARKFSIKRKIKLINKLKVEKGRLLDIGCGTGDFLAAAKLDGWVVTGIEPDSGARTIATNKTQQNILSSESFWSLKKGYFDIITLWHVLEHLPDLDRYISNCRQLLKPNGVIIVAVPNYKSYDAKYYESYWAAYDVPRHLWHFSRDEISHVFSNHNMIIADTKPLTLDSFYVSLLSEKYKNKRTNYLNAFWIGCVSNLKAMSSGEYSSLIYLLKSADKSI